jgi:hypothetical protein
LGGFATFQLVPTIISSADAISGDDIDSDDYDEGSYDESESEMSDGIITVRYSSPVLNLASRGEHCPRVNFVP